ncbi:MAG: DUF2797 domain-containing protein [Pseudomonadales bacterium]|jgi:hypothetical protein|nr:DUF2797 domain-containing protein [Pseudomonadales bacterium]
MSSIGGVIVGLRYERADTLSCSLAVTMLEGERVENNLALNPLLGLGVEVTFSGRIECTHCAARTPRSYGGGYCYDCFRTLARCDLCVVSPDRCHYDQGTCREPDWGRAYCMQPHTVYLANSSGPKVGITRRDRELHRWMDQGAIQGLPIAYASTRRSAGELEVTLATRVPDRTDWRRLTSGDVAPVDLTRVRDQLRAAFERQTPDTLWLDEAPETCLRYPVLGYGKPLQQKLENGQSVIGGVLLGIKGQYLLFDSGVFNVGQHRGHEIELSQVDEPRRPAAGRQLELF